jgi:hypothetical protein
VTPWLMVLRWRCDMESASIVIFRDEMEDVEWSRWQARLQLQASQDIALGNELQ